MLRRSFGGGEVGRAGTAAPEGGGRVVREAMRGSMMPVSTVLFSDLPQRVPPFPIQSVGPALLGAVDVQRFSAVLLEGVGKPFRVAGKAG